MIRLTTLLPLALLGGCATDQNLTLDQARAPVVAAGVATMPDCPDWRQEQVPQSAPATSRNYGCALTANLAAMLDDPRDLLRGRTGGAGLSGATSVKAIKMWRDTPPSGEVSLKRTIVEEAPTGGGGGKP